MGAGATRHTLVPWHIESADLVEAGDPELVRDLLVEGRAERHLALHVVGQFNPGLSLGLLAIRWVREGARVIPETLSIPDTPIVRLGPSAVTVGIPRSARYRQDAEYWRGDER